VGYIINFLCFYCYISPGYARQGFEHSEFFWRNPVQGDRKGQYHLKKKPVSKGAVCEMEALIWGTFAAQPGLAAFEDARIASMLLSSYSGSGKRGEPWMWLPIIWIRLRRAWNLS